MSIFLCFTLKSLHSPPIDLHKKRYFALHWNVSPYRCVDVFMHRLQTSYCSLAPQAEKDILLYIYIYFLVYVPRCHENLSDSGGNRSGVVFSLP